VGEDHQFFYPGVVVAGFGLSCCFYHEVQREYLDLQWTQVWVRDSSDQKWTPLVVWELSSIFHDLDQPISMKMGPAGMLIDRSSLVRLFDPTACHYEVLQVVAEHHQGGYARNCRDREPHCAVGDHLVLIPNDPSLRHVFSAIEVWTKLDPASLLCHVEVSPSEQCLSPPRSMPPFPG
jgi:hypothetical protein